MGTVKTKKRAGKYILLSGGDNERYIDGTAVRRIQLIRDIEGYAEGTVGGFVENEYNLSHYGNCFIADNAAAIGKSLVTGNALVKDNALLHSTSELSLTEVGGVANGDCIIRGRAIVCGGATVQGYAVVEDEAYVFGNAVVREHGHISGEAHVGNGTIVKGYVHVGGDTTLSIPNLVIPTYAEIGSDDDYFVFGPFAAGFFIGIFRLNIGDYIVSYLGNTYTLEEFNRDMMGDKALIRHASQIAFFIQFGCNKIGRRHKNRV